MRLLLALGVLLAPLAALADPPSRPVRVTNFPEVQEVIGSVEVSNLPGPSGGACELPFRLVGFTAAVFTGNLGGPFGVTQKCQAEFPRSRICRYSEAVATLQLPAGLAGFAWVNLDASAGFPDLGFMMQCDSWARESLIGPPNLLAPSGQLVGTSGGAEGVFHCGQEHPIACCAAP